MLFNGSLSLSSSLSNFLHGYFLRYACVRSKIKIQKRTKIGFIAIVLTQKPIPYIHWEFSIIFLTTRTSIGYSKESFLNVISCRLNSELDLCRTRGFSEGAKIVIIFQGFPILPVYPLYFEFEFELIRMDHIISDCTIWCIENCSSSVISSLLLCALWEM